MKSMLTAVVSAATLAGTFIPAAGEAQAPGIVILAPPTLKAWSQRVFTDLNRHIHVRPPMGRGESPTGIAAVKFNCSEDGAPAGVELFKSSGNRELDAATVRAVRRIASLHPLPTGLGHGQTYVVRVLFASSDDSAKRQIARMQREATQSNAWYGHSSTKTAALELIPWGG